jgi:pilus assembly protein Flp/PilA
MIAQQVISCKRTVTFLKDDTQARLNPFKFHELSKKYEIWYPSTIAKSSAVCYTLNRNSLITAQRRSQHRKQSLYQFFSERRNIMFLPNEEGQGLVEYALIIVLVAIVVIAALTALGTNIQGVFQSISDSLNVG